MLRVKLPKKKKQILNTFYSIYTTHIRISDFQKRSNKAVKFAHSFFTFQQTAFLSIVEKNPILDNEMEDQKEEKK